MKVVPLGVEPDVGMIEHLEELLKRARAGEIMGVLTVAQDTMGAAQYSVQNMRNRFEILGYLSHAMHQLQSDK